MNTPKPQQSASTELHELYQGGRVRRKMGMSLAWSQGMVSMTCTFQTHHQVLALGASCPQHLSLRGAHHGHCPLLAAA